MSQFPSTGDLATWAGTCPGSNECAGCVKLTKTRLGNSQLKTHSGQRPFRSPDARAPIWQQGTDASPRAQAAVRAVVAIEGTRKVASWNIAQTGAH
jgi:transposase